MSKWGSRRHDRAAAESDMVTVPGATLRMGAEGTYPEESPVHDVEVDPFLLDRFPVTNARFAIFVADIGYRTSAERPVDPADYPDAAPALVHPGSSVFVPSRRPVNLSDLRNWWRYVPGASWRHPEGPGSDLAGRKDHPVVHVTHEDASRYAMWAGKTLPSEPEWELAARGGLVGATYAWGDELEPGGRTMANTWEGPFPWRRNSRFERTSPVGSFPPNGYDAYDMIGNVWEWTADPWQARRTPPNAACCAPQSGGPAAVPTAGVFVVKGGSFLCSPSYCRRYRPSARQGQPADTSTSHVGFRCAISTPTPTAG